jgi:hypothetical protein
LKTATFWAQSTLLNRHFVEFYHCPACGFIQTQEPYWLEEAYAAAINRADVGLIGRNLRLAKISKAVIFSFFADNGRFIDYGGGYGLFVRLMRDAGYDFYRYDKHCANLFAQNFEAEPDGHGQYELLTAFELFEHLVNPLMEIENMLTYSSNIFFTTELLPVPAPQPEDWSYYGLDHGQHVSFYTRRSLEVIAERFSLNLFTDGKVRHLLTQKDINPFLYNIAATYKVAALMSPLTGRKSLVPADFRMISGKELK